MMTHQSLNKTPGLHLRTWLLSELDEESKLDFEPDWMMPRIKYQHFYSLILIP